MLGLRPLTDSRSGEAVVFAGSRVRIGRSRDNDFVLPDRSSPRASAHHAEARLEDGQWWIVDLSSTNGTLLNDAVVHRERLETGDRLTIGDDVLLVEITPSAPRGRTDRLRRPLLAAIGGALVIAAVVALRLGGVSRSPATARALEDVAASVAPSVFLIAVNGNTGRSMVGTGFAVASDAIATNAHVAAALQRARTSSSRSGLAIRSDAFDASRIVGVVVHPDWVPGSLANDVAILRLEGGGAPLVPLSLADDAALSRLRRGVMVATLGFPVASTDLLRPRGRLTVDVISDVRSPYFEVGLGISPGTSGSPVFTGDGTVVAIVAGGDFVDGAGRTGRHPSGTEANWAISIAAVRGLLKKL